MRRILAIVLALGAALSQMLVLQHCANPVPPQGGARDSIGPVLLLEESTPPFQTNFRPDRIELTFDEWVRLKDPTQIIISPPIEPTPRVSLKRRTLIIDFEEAELRDSATYVINVGEAIVDLTEGNPPDNLRFVFATGPALDSASVSGILVDAYTREPIKQAIFALYANLADTAVTTENPFYFAKSDEEGHFEISNVRPGRYRGVALDNGGFGGYKLDNRSTKQLGLLDSILLIPDARIELGEVGLFTPDRGLRVTERDTSRRGLVKIVSGRPARQLGYRSTEDYLRVNDKDSLKLFYRHERRDTLFFGLDTLFTDTLYLRPRASATYPIFNLAGKSASNQNPTEAYWLSFSVPPRTVDTPMIRLFLDTFPDPVSVTITSDTLYPDRLYFRAPWTEDGKYRLQVLPGGLSDYFGQTNRDTIATNFRVTPRKSLGNLSLQLTGLDSTLAYVARLVKGGNRDVVKEFLIPIGNSEFVRVYGALEPATYQLELIADENGNGRYDPGSYEAGRLPERVKTFNIEALRANWDVEATIDAQTGR